MHLCLQRAIAHLDEGIVSVEELVPGGEKFLQNFFTNSDPWIVLSGCFMDLAPVGGAAACQLAIGIGVLSMWTDMYLAGTTFPSPRGRGCNGVRSLSQTLREWGTHCIVVQPVLQLSLFATGGRVR